MVGRTCKNCPPLLMWNNPFAPRIPYSPLSASLKQTFPMKSRDEVKPAPFYPCQIDVDADRATFYLSYLSNHQSFTFNPFKSKPNPSVFICDQSQRLNKYPFISNGIIYNYFYIPRIAL